MSDDDLKEQHLRFTDALTEVPNGDVQVAEELLLQGRGLTKVDSLEPFKNLKKLELKENRISSLGVDLSSQHGTKRNSKAFWR